MWFPSGDRGAVAQLVAHLHGMQGVRGSNPLSSTESAGQRPRRDPEHRSQTWPLDIQWNFPALPGPQVLGHAHSPAVPSGLTATDVAPAGQRRPCRQAPLSGQLRCGDPRCGRGGERIPFVRGPEPSELDRGITSW